VAAIFTLLVTQAHAASSSPWSPLADRVFRPLAPTTDAPNALIPNSIAESADGFLWMGGDAGIIRWDGYEFREYPAEPTRPGGLRNADVDILHRDTAGRLWVGTMSGGVGRYDPAQDRWVSVPLENGRCAGHHVWALADDGAGGLYVGCRGGLIRLDPQGHQITDPARAPGQPASPPDEDVFGILVDHAGVIWAATHHGLKRSTDGGHHFSGFPGMDVTELSVGILMEDSANRVWVGTGQHGAYVIGPDRAAATQIAVTASPNPATPAVYINALQEVTPGTIWIATEGHGIVEVDGATLQTRSIRHDPLVPNGLPDSVVEELHKDRSGLIWISTDSGITTYNAAATGVLTVFGDPSRRDGLASEDIIALLPGDDGTLWAGLEGAGFALLDPHGVRTTGLPGHRVLAITPAPGGGVLLGTDTGTYRADAAGHVLGPVTVPGMPENTVIHVLRNIGGTVWISSGERGAWAFRLDAQGKATLVRQITAAALSNARVEAFAPAPDGRVAIGTDDGFALVDVATGAIERVAPDPMDADGLAPGSATSFVTDAQGRLWVGTSSGIHIMTGRDPHGRAQFRHLGVADGLPNLSIESLVTDQHGKIWASTDHGVAVIDPHTLSVRGLQRADGLAVTNYAPQSAAALPDGEIAFGGIGGVTILQPDAIRPWAFRPPVVITGLRVGGTPLRRQLAADELVVVPPAGNAISVEFAALDYSAPAQNRYSYRLDGFDTGWTEADSRHRTADYTNLPPGTYQLHLRGSNHDGVWSEPDTTLRIQVMPAWYQLVWFRAGVITIAALAALAALQRSTDTLRRRQRELERQVATRTVELSQSQRQLQAANAELETRVAERTQALAERSAALQASEARFRAWFDHAEDAMFVVQVHQDGGFTYEALNAAITRIFGVAPTVVAGRRPEQIFPATYAGTVIERYREAARGEPIHYEGTYHIAGVDRLIDTWIVPLRNAATGRVERLVGASRDLTERRALEARLAQAQKLQALGGLAGGIAHDFNNILQAVAGAAMLMEQRPDDAAKILRLSRSVQAATERGTSITRRLLAFARSDALRVEAIQTEDVLSGIADVLKYTLGSAISIVTEFAPDLPSLLADRGQLETALVNLGTNARDAMPQGGYLTLAACAEAVPAYPPHRAGLAAGAYVRIDVTDSGAGMDASIIARAVEPFFTTKPQGQGTGLGLAQVKGFAEQSGGQMSIASRPGRGTTVSLWLRQAAGDGVRAVPGLPVRAKRQPARETILVVDDDALVRETLAEQLQYAGFNVLMAENGAQALGVMQSGTPPDALICDLSMPGMDGVQTIRAARALHPALRCFLLTGYAGERAGVDGAEGYTVLRKPITADALIGQIEASLTKTLAW
jgi:PAS domain S-box-containing protein